MFSLESPHYTIFNIKKKITLNYPNSAAMEFFLGTQERVRNSRGKRVISVRATEVLLYVKTLKRLPLRVCLGRAYRSLTGWFLLLRNFSVAISVSPHVCFILVLILISMFLRKCIYELEIFHANRTTECLRNQGRTKGEGWSTAN